MDGLRFGKVLDNLAEDGLGTITMQVYTTTCMSNEIGSIIMQVLK